MIKNEREGEVERENARKKTNGREKKGEKDSMIFSLTHLHVATAGHERNSLAPIQNEMKTKRQVLTICTLLLQLGVDV